MRVAVLGTYRSGSSAVAGVLHYLGVDMGGPFWGEHFESAELAQVLRQWWSEPRLVAAMASQQRQEHLRTWITARLQRSDVLGAKHPLLSLCGRDLVEAWGEETKFLWCRRSLDDSISSLKRMGWWPDAERIQRKLHEACVEFFDQRECFEVEYADTRDDPRKQVALLAETLGLRPSDSQVEQAIAWIENWPDNERAWVMSGFEGASVVTGQEVERPFKIVGTMLSGNSDAIVAEAVESVIDWIDELCLIDTGITDNTVEKVAGVAGDKLCLRSFEWCDDFATARNASLSLADEREATWALTVDTDERFAFPGIKNRQALHELLVSEPDVQAWMVPARDGSYSKERFIRIPTKTQWRGKTHEALTAEGRLVRKPLQGCYFWETAKSAESYQHKVQRDLVILLEETQLQPLNPRWWYYLGQTYEGLKEFRQAVEAYDRCIRLDGWPDESAWACYAAARCLVSLKEYREAEEYCSLGLTRKPSSAELAWLAGWCCFQRGAMQPAITWCKLSIVLGRDKSTQNAATFRHVPAWYEAPYDVLRHAFTQLGKSQDAELAERDYKAAREDRLTLHS